TRTYQAVLECHGWGDVTARLHRKSIEGDWKGMADLITDEMLDAYAVTAPYDRLHAAMEARYAGLLDRTALYQPYPPRQDDPRLPALIKAFNG
ncbi:MAG TPA: LLM class F420-dependent oxidoreductase, partial [Methylomirabilota bacterium]|nr:LLM class F420-dependent oxidoreductase [Methylomirabilota bacterium]